MSQFGLSGPIRILGALLLFLISATAQGQDPQDRVSDHAKNQHAPTDSSFDHRHSIWDKILKDHVRVSRDQHSTRVDYAALKKNPDRLKEYLNSLSSVTEVSFKSYTREEQLALLINAYNAFTIDLIVKNYPVTSIKRIGIPIVGPWKRSFIPLLGRTMSLDDLEHGLIRQEYREPLIHFGVNCASISCPPLRAEAFVGEKLSQQLQEQAARFFSNTDENRFDKAERTLVLNPILDWFSEDFTTTGAAGHVLYVSQFHPELKAALQGGLKAADINVKFGDYNWSLNDITTEKQ